MGLLGWFDGLVGLVKKNMLGDGGTCQPDGGTCQPDGGTCQPTFW